MSATFIPTVTPNAWAPNLPNEPEDSLYAVLGVPRDATRTEIDIAFLRFRYSDASENEATKSFNMDRVEYAYSVLSDALKRKLYNQFGEHTLRLFENRYAMDAADWLGLQIAALVGTIIAFLLVLSIFVLILNVALKLDGRITTPWGVVLIPLWMFWALLHGTLQAFGCMRAKKMDAAKPDAAIEVREHQEWLVPPVAIQLMERAYVACFLWSYTAASILIPFSAESSIPAWAPFVASGTAELSHVLRICAMTGPAATRKEFARRGVPTVRIELIWSAIITNLCRAFHWLVMWIVLPLRLADVVVCSYFWVFVPLFAALVFWILATWTMLKVRQEAEPDKHGSEFIIKNLAGHAFGCSLIAATLVLLALRLDGIIATSYLACIAPLLVFFFVALCVIVFMMYHAAALTVEAPLGSDPAEEFAAVAHRSKSATTHHIV